MIDLIERIGPIVGVVAFLGLAVLAFLIFQQGREVRRLREWAGRAPERAEEAAEASVAAAEARGDATGDGAGEDRPGRLRRFGRAIGAPFRPLWERLDRNSPFDPVYLIVIVIAGLVAAGALTGGFGLLGDEDGGGERRAGGGQGQGARQNSERERPVEVAVLNATQIDPETGVPIQGVPGLAERVAEEVVRPIDGFRPGAQDNSVSGLVETRIMFEEGAREGAERLATEVEPVLGETIVEPMIEEVRGLVDGAPVAIVVGQDDSEI